jgi:transcriptional regulator of met regulon
MVSRYYHTIEPYQKEVKKMSEKVRNITIRIPYDIWKKLRRMQEDEKVKSIQEACIEGLKRIIDERG